MSNPNEHVNTYLQDYINRPEPSFAVLVSASWGAGKTHLVKELINNQEEAVKPLYISLFGVNNGDDINEAILMARMPVLDNDLVKIGGRVGAAAMKLLPIDLSGFKPADFAKLKLPKVLVFDDLERSNMDAKALLGYLNSFVEHEGKHLILLANEGELWKEEERRTKEKLIGHTLTMQADVDAALAAMIEALGDDGAKTYLTTHQDEVKRVFGQSATNNLRILGQCLWDFERLFMVLDKDHRENEAGMSELLGLFLALSIEYKSGGLEREDMAQRDAFTADDSKEPKLEKLLLAQGKYTGENVRYGRHGCVLQTDFAIALICDGWVAADEVNKALSQSSHFSRVEKETEWETVLRAWDRDEADVAKAVRRMTDKFLALAYHDAGEVLLVFIGYMRLPEMGFLKTDISGAEKQCHAYIDDLAKTGNLRAFDPALDWREGYGYDENSHLGFGWPTTDRPSSKAFRRLYDYMRKTQDRLFEGSFAEISAELLGLMQADTSLFKIRLSGRNTGGAWYQAHPVLKNMDVVAFVDTLLEVASIQQHAVFDTLNERYKFPEDKLKEERDWLEAVARELSGRMKGLSDFKRWQLQNLIDHSISLIIKDL